LFSRINAANEKQWGAFIYEFMMLMKPLEVTTQLETFLVLKNNFFHFRENGSKI
jgi:hypothetical protein